MHKLLDEVSLWDAASHDDRLAAALVVADSLSPAFSFQGLEAFALGDQSREIAMFHHRESTFALVPGNSNAELGYDRAVPYPATEEQLVDWQIVHDEFGCTLFEYLDECLSKHRHVAIAPFLVEINAQRLDYGQSGDDQAEGYTHIRTALGDDFRLPTSDEWEYFCAAGTRTLFRWGNDCPVSNSYHDQEFTLHKRPNAFGVSLNSSTYDTEICLGPEMRGGDGGGSVCGGIGNVITWLPLASSFKVPSEEIEGWWIDDVFARRVKPIA